LARLRMDRVRSVVMRLARLRMDRVRSVVMSPLFLLGCAVLLPFLNAIIYTRYFLPSCIRNALVRKVGGALVFSKLATMKELEGSIQLIAIYVLPFEGIAMHVLAALCGATYEWANFSMACLSHTCTILLLPIYFALLKSSEAAEDRRAVRYATSIRLSLPWEIGSISLSGAVEGWVAEVLTTGGGVNILTAFVCFYSLVGFATTTAVLAARLQLLQQVTISRCLSISSLCSLLIFTPRILWPSKCPSFARSAFLLLVTIPAAVATVYALAAFDVVPMVDSLKSIDNAGDILWYCVVFWSMDSNGP
ncbi:hypothetical protein PMAYCL1PPCAC_26469, partial [Pristionchus mayeri]